ncbi:MAG: cellulose synthase subunit BcsC-related outer membrane protein, partial [Alphaproteobacteria bacterium]
EYYETLAGSPNGIKEARNGLRELYESRRDPKTGLPYARVLTYRKSTRRQGIDLLEQLSADQDPRVAAEATDSWGKALTRLGAKKSDVKRYDRYLARYPDDAAVQRAKDKANSDLRKARSGKGRRDRYGEARASGFKLLESGDTQGAREKFDFALRKNSRDSDALGGLGVIAMREGRFAEARDYLSRATARSRTSRAKWGEALASAEFWSAYGEADAARLNGDYARAESIARSLQGRSGDEGQSVLILLGNSLAGLGRQSEAEQAFRNAQQYAPNDTSVELGIFNALMGQNRQEEAFVFSQQMSPEAQQSVGQMSGLRANALRDEALQTAQSGQYGVAANQLEQAQQEPSNLAAMRGAVGAAIQAKDIRTASILLDQAVKLHPSDPHIYFLMGEAARARGDRRTARRAFETARSLRQQEISASVASGGSAVEGLPPNPFENVGLPASNYRQQAAPSVIVPQGVNVPMSSPIGGRNPFDRSSLDMIEINGEDSVTHLVGDAGEDKLLAQAYSGNASTIIENAGSESSVFRTTSPEQSRGYQPTSSDVYLPAFVNPAERTQYAEPTLTEQIDDRLNEMNSNRGHFVQGGVALRSRDGDGGLDSLTEVQVPLSYTFVPQDIGNFTLSATPVFITAGSLEGGEANLRRFGTNPLAQTGSVLNPGTIDASGVGLSAAFEGGWIRGDAGVTPLGFEAINPVGGITFQPKLNEEVSLRFTVEQRAVTDSVLSYSGVKDTRSGATFGGVVRRGGTIGGDIDTGDFGAYISGGYYFLEGENVQDNEMAEATVGAYNRVINRPDEELKIGLNATFFGYDQNLRHFTAGHGGYFSPQTYASVSAPVEYTKQEGRLTYQVGGAIGIQRFEEDGAQVFPGRAADSAQLNIRNNIAGFLGNSAILNYNSEEQTSLGFNAYGRMEYAMSDRTNIGAGARLDAAADWFEGTAFLYLRQTLGGKLYGGQ